MKYNPKNYRYLGYTYPDVPKSWKPIVIQLIKDIDKIARPKWLPRFLANWFKWLAQGNSVVMVRSRFWNKIFDKIGIKCYIHQIKDKYATLRVYASATDDVYALIELAEKAADNTCEHCGSTDRVEEIGRSWVFRYCHSCRMEYNK